MHRVTAETHLFGSDRGYRTLASSPGLRGDEAQELVAFGFGQSGDRSLLASFEHDPCVMGRLLGSGRFAITRVFAGPIDDAGRATLELRSLVFDRSSYDAICDAGLTVLVGNDRLWGGRHFRDGRGVVTIVAGADETPATSAEIAVLDAWLEVRGDDGRLAVLSRDRGVDDAVLSLPRLLVPGDRPFLRWGLRMLSADAPVDVCTVDRIPASTPRRRVVVRTPADPPRHPYAAYLAAQAVAGVDVRIGEIDRATEAVATNRDPVASPRRRGRRWLVPIGSVAAALVLLGVGTGGVVWWLAGRGRGSAGMTASPTPPAASADGFSASPPAPSVTGVAVGPPEGRAFAGRERDVAAIDDDGRPSGAGRPGERDVPSIRPSTAGAGEPHDDLERPTAPSDASAVSRSESSRSTSDNSPRSRPRREPMVPPRAEPSRESTPPASSPNDGAAEEGGAEGAGRAGGAFPIGPDVREIPGFDRTGDHGMFDDGPRAGFAWAFGPRMVWWIEPGKLGDDELQRWLAGLHPGSVDGVRLGRNRPELVVPRSAILAEVLRRIPRTQKDSEARAGDAGLLSLAISMQTASIDELHERIDTAVPRLVRASRADLDVIRAERDDALPQLRVWRIVSGVLKPDAVRRRLERSGLGRSVEDFRQAARRLESRFEDLEAGIRRLEDPRR